MLKDLRALGRSFVQALHPVEWGLLIIGIGVVCALAACRGGPASAAAGAAGGVLDSVAKALGPGDGSFGILDVLASLCAVAAVGSVIAAVFLKGAMPPKLTGTLILCAVGCWVLKLVLVKYLWLVGLVSVIGLLAAGGVAVYGHRNWLERRLGVDLDRDGDIGR